VPADRRRQARFAFSQSIASAQTFWNFTATKLKTKREEMIDINSFFSKVVNEYPILLVAEILVILTTAIAIAIFRRILRPLAEQNIYIYRQYRIRKLSDKEKLLNSMIDDVQIRIMKLIDSVIRLILSYIFVIINGMITAMIVIALPKNVVTILVSQFLLLICLICSILAVMEMNSFFNASSPSKYQRRVQRRLQKLRPASFDRSPL
jgi:hypothetical protein